MSPRPPEPLYRKVESELRQRIERGEFSRGALLPSERELCQLYDVSIVTVKRALSELALDGLVETSKGRRARVVRRVATTHSGATVEGLIEGVLEQSITTRYRAVGYRLMRPHREVTDSLRLPANSQVYRTAIVATRNDMPFAHIVSYVPEEIGRLFPREQLEQKPMLLLLDGAGIELHHGSQFLGARPADKKTAELLAVPTSSPVVHVRRTLYDQRGHGVEYMVAFSPWNRFEYEVRLSRATKTAVSTLVRVPRSSVGASWAARIVQKGRGRQ
ncbi:MAG: GntR family transcriptional regulator [Alphaproteobacteria bacterium]|nr:GntR family transcriptional regulator [Alphaproteobacteria bacterium]